MKEGRDTTVREEAAARKKEQGKGLRGKHTHSHTDIQHTQPTSKKRGITAFLLRHRDEESKDKDESKKGIIKRGHQDIYYRAGTYTEE